MISMDAKIQIERVENGYTIRISNNNHISYVFLTIQHALNFIKEYMERMSDLH